MRVLAALGVLVVGGAAGLLLEATLGGLGAVIALVAVIAIALWGMCDEHT